MRELVALKTESTTDINKLKLIFDVTTVNATADVGGKGLRDGIWLTDNHQSSIPFS